MVTTGRHEAQPIAALGGLGDPVDVFRKLDAELRAADALIRMSSTPAEQRRAALDGLQLARDVLADALDVLDVVDDEHTREQLTRPVADVALPVAGFTTSRTSCACGLVDDFDPAFPPMLAGLMHDGIVCTSVCELHERPQPCGECR